MKKRLKVRVFITFITFLLAAIMVVAIFFLKTHKSPDQNQYEGFARTTFTMNEKTYHFLVADTEKKRENGLMFYRSLPGVDGMIFLFPDKALRSFWNKNTLMNLDIYWVDGMNVVGKTFLPSVEEKGIVIVNSDKKVDKVIEIPSKKTL